MSTHAGPRESLRSRLFAASIWGPGGIPEEDDRLKSWLRIWLPLSYLTSTAFGILGMIYGVPAIYDVISRDYSTIWAGGITILSLLALVGLAFPHHLRTVDFYANCSLVAGLCIYSGSLCFLAFHQPPVDGRAADRAALAIGSLRLIYGLCWRAFDLARERTRLHAVK